MHRNRWATLVACTTLLLAACGDDADDASSTPHTTAEAETPATSVPSTTTEPADQVPQRIVSLSPTATEMIFAIGAQDLLVAVDDYSYYPPEALDLPHELSGYEPNVEAIAGYEPDLVLVGGDFTGLGDQLAPLGIDVWDGPAAATLDDTYAQIEQLGAITGHIGEAAELVAQIQTDIAAIVAAVTPADPPLTYFHEVDNMLYSVTSDTFAGQIYTLLGLENIADAAEGAADAGGYPQLSAEFVVDADPDLIFLADAAYGESPDTVAARPGWADLKAVTGGSVIAVDADLASRWGPRVVDFVRVVADAVSRVGAPA